MHRLADFRKEMESSLGPISQSLFETWEKHFAALQDYNPSAFLVSQGAIPKAWGAHYADSAQIAKIAISTLEKNPLDYVDVGSGAGFPGLVFASMAPSKKVYVFEKNLKKLSFLDFAVREMGLSKVVLGAALPEGKHRGLFTARAVKPPEQLLKFFSTRLLPGSLLLVCVGGSGTLPQPPKKMEVVAEHSYQLPADFGLRRVFILRST